MAGHGADYVLFTSTVARARLAVAVAGCGGSDSLAGGPPTYALARPHHPGGAFGGGSGHDLVQLWAHLRA